MDPVFSTGTLSDGFYLANKSQNFPFHPLSVLHLGLVFFSLSFVSSPCLIVKSTRNSWPLMVNEVGMLSTFFYTSFLTSDVSPLSYSRFMSVGLFFYNPEKEDEGDGCFYVDP